MKEKIPFKDINPKNKENNMKKLVLSLIAVLSIVSISLVAGDKKKDDKKAAPAQPAPAKTK